MELFLNYFLILKENLKLEYQYIKTKRFFARVSEDIKPLAERELESLGAKEIKSIYKGIYFSAKKETLYKIVFRTRFITRILAPLITFKCHSDKYLYKTAKDIEWRDFLSLNQTFSINSIVNNSNIKNSKFAALRLKDAIVDYFRDKFGKRPSVKKIEPDVFFDLYIEKNRAVISIDVSGGSLHRRGYRIEAIEAPISEIVASAIIEYSEWDGKKPLYDPFCGSGTLLCEAYIKATNTPASMLRKNFGFRYLPDYDRELWNKVRRDEISKIKDIDDNLIFGSDISERAVKIAKNNCLILDKNKRIKIMKRDFFKIDKIENSLIVFNPPYGIRMGREEDLELFYRNMGDFLKHRCKNSSAIIYFGERKYLKKIGLKPRWKKILFNGGLEGRLARFDIY